MADSFGEEFIALGELRGMFSPPLVKMGDYTMDSDMLRVRITRVRRRDTILPKPVVDELGRVLCRTIGEAYETKSKVLWYERHTVVPNEDGCTHSSF
jgi:hypothetical protein